ncbi:isoaspartyl peptidase/L-asparaginase family protein [Seonamhaeicola aphaedonensis]|uniref:Isoaspartyl peptidase n=1 Tax=Seonamhaeicola aphaedonensis TaxID=1461338 RepID=A0A3D9HAR5_9FLAO|nr:isoaspartyl peptidase/L-asparaginase [Seonamhaeicola aphaedonensis]RED46066.1 beta-aspartyl-peptidase (threonine type) [Seonamhaeicola aphaedonensis]
MRKILPLILFFIVAISCKYRVNEKSETPQVKANSFAIVIHGGAGDGLIKEYFNENRQKLYSNKLQEALDSGYKILENGGSSLDAVQGAISILENSPLFNAGRGAVYNSEGNQEMDASIMDGKTLNSGAVAGINHVKNPIMAARMVMDSTEHVMLSGKGAEQAMEQFGLDMVDSTYFFVQNKRDQLEQIKSIAKKKIIRNLMSNNISVGDSKKYGTVGAVAIDKEGNIAAGTSTGGISNKKYGRIGDSPIVGAGTYANNLTCGISATGTGEIFIRTVAAHEVSSLIQYKQLSPPEALHEVLNNQIKTLGGKGGMILLDKSGNIFWDFNTKGMFRGYKKSSGENVIEMFK